MTNLRRKVLANGTRVLDLSIMLLTFFTSLYLHAPEEAPSSFIEFYSMKIKLVNLITLFLLVVAWNWLFNYFGLYETRRLGNILKEWFDIFRAVTIGVLIVAAIGTLTARKNVTADVLLNFWIFCVFLTIFARLVVRRYLIYLRNVGRNLRFIVFVGSNSRAIDLAQKVMSRKELGFRLLGFVDDEVQASELPGPKAKTLCKLDEFPEYLENHIVDEVYIVLPIKSYYEKIVEIINVCQDVGIVCRVSSNWFEFKMARTAAFELEGEPILTLYTGSNFQLEHLWLKRGIDVVLSGLGMILLFPLFITLAVLVKLTSKGPIFFKQERIGYNRRKFYMIKFRTMVTNAEELMADLEHLNEMDGPAFKIIDDPRITTFGRWLRRTSLDELPQLLNVFKGDMSLVGPRPLPIRDVDGIEERWQKRRFSMRPGLTCLWQIGGRNDVAFSDWMKLDLEYIDKWSLTLDFKILAKTIPAVIRATGH